MIAGLLAGLVFGKTGYYTLLGWCCVTIFVFTVRGRGLCSGWMGGPPLNFCGSLATCLHWLFLVGFSHPSSFSQIRSLRLKILSEATEGVPRRDTQNQVRMYLTVAVAVLQPLLMYWLTSHLI